MVKSKLPATLLLVQEKMKANASKLDLTIQHMSRTTSNVPNTLVAMAFSSFRFESANVQSLAFQDPVATIPYLNDLRQDIFIQNQVEKQLYELAESVKTGICKQNLLRGGPVKVIAPNRVKWPHEYILSDSQKERISYNQLSVTE